MKLVLLTALGVGGATVVGVLADARLVGRNARCGDVLAEVHAEIGEVLEDEYVVLVGHVADDLQLLLGETDPGRIVGVGVHDGVDVALLEVALQFGAKLREWGIRGGLERGWCCLWCVWYNG